MIREKLNVQYFEDDFKIDKSIFEAEEKEQ